MRKSWFSDDKIVEILREADRLPVHDPRRAAIREAETRLFDSVKRSCRESERLHRRCRPHKAGGSHRR